MKYNGVLLPAAIALAIVSGATRAQAGENDATAFRQNPITAPAGPWQATDLEAASGDPARIRAAISHYQRDASAATTDVEVAWRLAKAYFHLYDELPREAKADRTKAAEQSAAYGRAAVAVAPTNTAAKYWYSQGLLAVGDMKGAVTFLSEVKTIKRLAAEVLAADPRIDDGGPDRFFAFFYHALPWPFGDKDAAFAHAQKAYEVADYRCVNRFLVARGLVERSRTVEARPLVESLVAGQCTASSPMWLEIYREYGRELAKKLDK